MATRKVRRRLPPPAALLAALPRLSRRRRLQIEDKKLKGKLRYNERLFADARASAAKVDEWLLPGEAGALEAEGMERTWRFSQQDIVQVGPGEGSRNVGFPGKAREGCRWGSRERKLLLIRPPARLLARPPSRPPALQAAEAGAGRKVFDLSLPQLGPYSLDFTRSGRHLLLAGRKGHLALLDWQRTRLVCEVQVKEATHAVRFLHNEQFFAAAQRKYVYIYDKRGLEVHCLKVCVCVVVVVVGGPGIGLVGAGIGGWDGVGWGGKGAGSRV